MAEQFNKTLDAIINQPVVGETYFNRLAGLEIEVKAIARGHVVCNAELTLTRDEFNDLYMAES